MRLSRSVSLAFIALLVSLSIKDACGQWTNVAPNLLWSGELDDWGAAICYKDGIVWAGYNGLFSSLDSGKSWTKNTLNAKGISDIKFFDKQIGFVSSQNGLFETGDGGMTWIPRLPDVCLSVGFGPTFRLIYACLHQTPGVIYSIDAGASWKKMLFPGSEGVSVTVGRDGTIYVYVFFNGYEGRIFYSTDQGTTWQEKLGATPGDSYSMAADSCNDKRLVLVNEEDASGPGMGQLILSTDGGDSWQTNLFLPIKYLVGSLTATSNVYYAGTLVGSIFRSTDRGTTWKEIPAPIQKYDSRSITCIDDNKIFLISSDGSIWRTFNCGGDSLHAFPGSAVGLTQRVLFDSDSLYLCNDSSSQIVTTFNEGCTPISISKAEIIGKDSLNYSIIPTEMDSIGVIFSPIQKGPVSANVLLTLSNGTKDTIALKGYGIASHLLRLTTFDKSTNIIGGTVDIPITISGLDHAEGLELVLHYDKGLKYDSALSAFDNSRIDLQNESWPGRSKIHIDQVIPNYVMGYARFEVFADSLTTPKVTFDSVTIVTALSPCQYKLPAPVTAAIIPPSGCGFQMVSRFMHDGLMPQLSIVPNPTSGEISITSTGDLGNVNATIYDMLGSNKGTCMLSINKSAPAKLALPVTNGVYMLRLRTADKTYDLRVVVDH